MIGFTSSSTGVSDFEIVGIWGDFTTSTRFSSVYAMTRLEQVYIAR